MSSAKDGAWPVRRWKYQFTEEKSPEVQRSLCERCYVEALQRTPGVYEVKMRQPTEGE